MSSGESRIDWLGHKMRGFGPATRLIQRRLATFKEIPPRNPSASSNAKEFCEEAELEYGFTE